MIAGLAAWWNQDWLKERIYALANANPLKTAEERTLKPKDSFKECSDCPEMIVVPAGDFMMGSHGHQPDEEPQHEVTIAKPFAVAKFELTFDEWAACVIHGDCLRNTTVSGSGRNRQPVTNVSWDDAQRYVAWLSRITGKPYRLLSEAEYEYVTRAGTRTAFPWGDDIGHDNANCRDCGSKWDEGRILPVGSFASNGFGLYDMVGNVREWVQDCYHPNYKDAPTDGSDWAVTCPDDRVHVVRAGSQYQGSQYLRSAYRDRSFAADRDQYLGFRVGRTLSAGTGAITVVPGAQ
jgi:formylglycine-generating enzyme required for sulfatase activity